MRTKYLPLAVLIAFFVIVRLCILFSGVDNFICDDELVSGTIAKMLVDGVSPGFIFHCFSNNRWGAAVSGIFIVPFFRLFGDSLVALRFAALVLSLGTLVLLYLFLYAFFNRRAAVLGALLFILSPPNYIKMSFILVGGYAETNFFSLLAFFTFYKIFFAGGQDRRSLYAFLGLISGFAFFYDYLYLLTLACLLLFWFIFDKGILRRKNFYIFTSCFLVAFSPWVIYNVTHHWNALFKLHDQSLVTLFTKNSFPDSLRQLKDLIASVIPGYLSAKDIFFIQKSVITWIYYCILVIACLGLFLLQRKSTARRQINPEMPLIVYLAVFGLAYAFCASAQFATDESIGFPERLVTYVMPHMLMVAALFLARVSQRSSGIWVFRTFAGALVAIGIINSSGMISGQDYRISSVPRGYNYLFAGGLFRTKDGADIQQSSGYVRTIDKKERRLFYFGYKWAMPKIEKGFSLADYLQKTVAGNVEKDYWPLAYEYSGAVIAGRSRYSKDIDEDFKSHAAEALYPYFYRGLGTGFVSKGINEAEYNDTLNVIDARFRPYFRQGLGLGMDGVFVDDFEGFRRFIMALDREAAGDILKGFAHGKEYPKDDYRKFRSGFGKILFSTAEWFRRADALDEASRPYCYQRLGMEVGWRFIYGVPGYLDLLRAAESRYKPVMYKGFATAIGWRFGYDLDGCMLLINKVEPGYGEYLYEGLGVGVARRYGCRLDETTRDKEAGKIPLEFRQQFHEGMKEAADGV